MDYLTTVLRRQWKLWGALPRGGAPAVPEEKGGRGGRETDADFRETALLWAEELRSPTAAEETAWALDPVSRRAEGMPEGTDTRLQRELLRRSAALRRALTTEETSREREPAERENRQDGGGERNGAEETGNLPRRRQFGESGAAGIGGTRRLAETEPDAPRAVSRQFEQDARRYDGGFFLY